jgi:hypothetical protein
LYPYGPLNEESAAYICTELQIENDVAYGNTKLFIKQPLVGRNISKFSMNFLF